MSYADIPSPSITIGPGDSSQNYAFHLSAVDYLNETIGLYVVVSVAASPAPAPTCSGNVALETWNSIDLSPNNVTAFGLATKDLAIRAYWMRLTDPTDPPTVTFNLGGGNWRYGKFYRIRGCPTSGNPINAAVASVRNTETTAILAPDVTTTATDCLIFNIASNTTETAANQASVANGVLLDWAAVDNHQSTSGSGGGILTSFGKMPTAGVAAGMTGTWATNTIQIAASIAIRSTTSTPALGSSVQPFRQTYSRRRR